MADSPFLVSPVTGAEYATAEKTDAATAFGMRLAMVEAARDYAAADANNKPDIATLLTDKAKGNEYLKAAGTSDVVAAYFESVTKREGADVKAFAEALEKDIGLDALKTLADKSDKKQGIFEALAVGQTANTFNTLAQKHLKFGTHGAPGDAVDETLTKDFKDTLQKAAKDGKPITDDITIEPQAFSEAQKEGLKLMHERFTAADKLFPPHIAHLISGPEQLPTDLVERKQGQPEVAIDEAAMLKDLATKLQAGPSAELSEAYYKARQHFAGADGVIDSKEALAFRNAYEKVNGEGSAQNAENTWKQQVVDANAALRAEGANVKDVVDKYRAQLDTDMDKKLDRASAANLSAALSQEVHTHLTNSQQVALKEEPSKTNAIQTLVGMLDMNQDRKLNLSDAYAAAEKLRDQVSAALSGLQTSGTLSSADDMSGPSGPQKGGGRGRA